MSIRSIQKNRGFTLLEALIGFLILSIGMLGIASLQSLSLQAGKTSVYSSVAMMKVEELFESMRANPTALATYEGDGEDKGCSTANCSEVDLAKDDRYWWEKNLKAGLPDAATTTITHTPSPSTTASKMDTVTIKVSWSERNKDTTEGAASSVSKFYETTANICTAIPC